MGGGGFWDGRKHHLDRMTLGELVAVFYRYPGIVVYHLLFVAAVALSLALARPNAWTLFWVAAATVNFSLSWYLLHRFLLQSTLLYRHRLTSRLWKRIHYDHHFDPNDLRVLFGSLWTTLPPMFLFAAAVAAVAGSLAHGLAFLATSLALTVWNEFCHCIQHLAVEPRFAYFRRRKKLHLIHHFQNERVYYGITNFLWDRLFGTYPRDPRVVRPSPTVFNLGYQGEVMTRYPWVRELSA